MRRRSKWLLWIGVSLIAVSLCAAAVFGLLQRRGVQLAADIAQRIESVLPPRTIGAEDTYSVMHMPTISIDGADFAGLVEIPAYGVKLPLHNDWKTTKLTCYPCRFEGTVYDGSLIIGGSAKQLACLKQMDIDDKVTVTDMQGAVFTYTVTRIRRADHADGQVLHSDAALTLFAPDGYNSGYIIVECE